MRSLKELRQLVEDERLVEQRAQAAVHDLTLAYAKFHVDSLVEESLASFEEHALRAIRRNDSVFVYRLQDSWSPAAAFLAARASDRLCAAGYDVHLQYSRCPGTTQEGSGAQASEIIYARVWIKP